MIRGLQRILPRDRLLVGQVWQEMNKQITNYILGKVIEIVIVGICTSYRVCFFRFTLLAIFVSTSWYFCFDPPILVLW